MAVIVIEFIKIMIRVYCIACLIGWLGGCLVASMLYGTNEIYPYQCVTLVTVLIVFPVVFSYFAVVGIELNLRKHKDD